MGNTTRDELENFIRQWCGQDECYHMLSKYFPLEVKLPARKDLFSNLIKWIEKSRQEEDLKIPIVVAVYGTVGVASIITNLFLLFCMLRVPHKSSTAVFLATLMFLDVQKAMVLLVQLQFVYTAKMPFLVPGNTWKRQITQFIPILWVTFSLFLLLLVTIDRWITCNTTSGRLFVHYRKLKFCSSIVLLAMLTSVVSYMLPYTVDIKIGTEEVEVYVCVTYWCTGSSLLQHPSRSSKDKRLLMSLRFLQAFLGFICMVLIPLYGCTWSAATKKVSLEKEYEDERDKLTYHGQELTYFDDWHRPTLNPSHKLPVIYEVEEDNTYRHQQMIFPYTIQVFHKRTSLCALTKNNNVAYDIKPVPENAIPVVIIKKKLNMFDNSVDDFTVKRLLKTKYRISTPPQFGSLSPKKKHRSNYNVNALPDTSLIFPSPRANKLSRTSLVCQASEQTSSGTCHSCFCRTRAHKGSGSFSTRQIVFNISCCSNRTEPIEYRTEIMYTNAMQRNNAPGTSDIHGLRNCSRSYKADGDGMKIITNKKTNMPAWKLEESSLSPDANNMYVAAPSSWTYSLHGRSLTERHTGISQGDSFCQYHRGCKSEREPMRALHSAELFKYSSMIKTVAKAINVTDATLDKFNQHCVNPSLPQHSNFEKHSFKQGHVNKNMNNRFLSSIKRQTRIYSNSLQHALKSMTDERRENNVAVVDPLTAETLMILYLVKEHFINHSDPLKPLGIPESLEKKETAFTAIKRMQIIKRLIFLTICHLALCLVPCLIELAFIPYDIFLYMSYYASGLLQFICLLIFSRDFRRKLARVITCR